MPFDSLDLFAAPQSSGDPEIFSVSDVVTLLSKKVNSIPSISVSGEVVGYRGPNARSGHCYFDIKDADAKLSITVWAGVFNLLDFQLADGLQIIVKGHFQVYKKGGSVSFVAEHIEIAGEGLLLKQIEELKRKLDAEGLFAPERKKRISAFCEHVICVTSLSGEVKDDVLQNINPLVDIKFVGCKVEGKGAEAEIIAALKRAEQLCPDAILLVRGGGSLESLMPFNDETVCRAIAASSVPVISGVGHEPDVTIADFVADRRCSTPTAAAQSVAPELGTVISVIDTRQSRLVSCLDNLLRSEATGVEHQGDLLGRSIQNKLSEASYIVSNFATRKCLMSPTYMVDERLENLNQDEQRLLDAMPRYLEGLASNLGHQDTRLSTVGGRLLAAPNQQVERFAASLHALSPLKVLGRGYAITKDENGHIIRDAAELSVGQNVSVKLGEGSFVAQVSSTSNDGN